MSATYSVLNPDDMDVEIKFRMSLRDWRKLKDDITTDKNHVSWKIHSQIQEMISNAEQTIWVNDKELR